MKVAIVTPTIASEHLAKCIASVDKQTYEDIVHYIFIDGCQYEPKAREILVGSSKTRMIELEENVGKGWYGHRVYAASSFLVNADIICYLDEDNWIEPEHIQKMVDTIKEGNQWAYSLRKIYDKDENFLCEDNCESLGKWPTWVDPNSHLIDTSSYCFKTSFFRQVCHLWDFGWGADRRFYSILKDHIKHTNYGCTGHHTLNYRLGGNEGSVTKEFFDQGNKVMYDKYKKRENFPWLSQSL